MTTNVSTIDFTQMKDLDSKGINQYISKNPSMFAGLDKESRTKLMDFARSTPGTAERDKFFVNSTPVENKKQESVKPVVQDVPVKPVENKEDKPVENKVEPKEPPQPDKNEKLQELMEQLARTTKEAEAHRKSNSRLGNDLTNLKKEKEALEKQLEEERAKKQAQTNDEVEPIEPDPESSKYSEDGGVLSDAYQRDLVKYQKELKMYFKNKIKTVESDAEAKIEKRLSDIQKLSSQSLEMASEYRTDKSNILADQEWSKLWNTCGKLQDKLGLKTSVDPKSISETLKIIENPGNVYTSEQVKSASDIINQMDQQSKDNFNKISAIINSMYDYSKGYPIKKDIVVKDEDLALAAVIKEVGLDLPPIPIKQTKKDIIDGRVADEKKTEGYVRAMPASEIGSNDQGVTNKLTSSEEVTKLKSMADRLYKDPKLHRDIKFMEEFKSLRDKLGYK